MDQKTLPNTAVTNIPNTLKVRLAIPLDKRLAFVNSVCTALVESRFGVGRNSGILMNFTSHPKAEDAIILEDIEGEFTPAYSMPFPVHIPGAVRPRYAANPHVAANPGTQPPAPSAIPQSAIRPPPG